MKREKHVALWYATEVFRYHYFQWHEIFNPD